LVESVLVPNTAFFSPRAVRVEAVFVGQNPGGGDLVWFIAITGH